MSIILGKLTKVEDLRTVWKHEAMDFTRWLAEPNNMALLSEAIGLDIATVQVEDNVGDFNVDIFAIDETSGKKIIIENQLEKTNHDHLGKIITYASGKDANYIVWIVKKARNEHRQAIDWLNEHTDTELNFFLIEMELWQIDDSALAPKFQIVCQPNDWTKMVKETYGAGETTELKTKQGEFWDDINTYCKQEKVDFNLRKALPHHWYDIAMGTSRAHISLWLNSKKKSISCNLYIGGRDKDENKDLYSYLLAHKEYIENLLGKDIEWSLLENKKASIIGINKNLDFNIKANWEQMFDWFAITASSFKRAFYDIIQDYEKRHE